MKWAAVCLIGTAVILNGCARNPAGSEPDDPSISADRSTPLPPSSFPRHKPSAANKEGEPKAPGLDPLGTGPNGDMEDGARPGVNPTTG